jgi:hypothetical protein
MGVSRLCLVAVLALALGFLEGVGGLSPPPAAATHLCEMTGSTFGPFNITAFDPEDYRGVYNETFELAAGNLLFPDDPYFGLPLLETGPRPWPPGTPVPVTPTPSPGGTETPTPEGTETPTPEGTGTPPPDGTETPTPEGTETPAPEGTDTPASDDGEMHASQGMETPTPEGTEAPTAEGTETPTPEATETPTPEGTETATPEGTETPTPDATETGTPTPSPAPFPPMESGAVEPYIAPTILKAIGWIESGWSQAAFSIPYGEIGPALISHDCGYGIMQVTSGMQNTTGWPTREQLMTGAHYAYNIARGARILTDKWNLAPEERPIVGDRNPEVIEDWYYAIWGYNGFAFQNHPLNPRFPAWPRTSYSCGPFDDGFGHDRSAYPYQELVYGCMSHPPQPDGLPLWEPQEVSLPDLSLTEFAEPLNLGNFVCDDAHYCYDGMDLPRPAGAHYDSAAVGGDVSKIVGSPRLEVNTLDVTFAGDPQDLGPPQEVAISNRGTGILVWTASPSNSWIQLSSPQGVALGTDADDLTSTLIIQPNMAGLLVGSYVGTLTVEAPYAEGNPRIITVAVQIQARSFVPGIVKS